jgi:hypothetical protein
MNAIDSFTWRFPVTRENAECREGVGFRAVSGGLSSLAAAFKKNSNLPISHENVALTWRYQCGAGRVEASEDLVDRGDAREASEEIPQNSRLVVRVEVVRTEIAVRCRISRRVRWP